MPNHDPDEQLLRAHEQGRDDRPRPSKPVRTPTRKERVVTPPNIERKGTVRERRDDPSTEEIGEPFRPTQRPPMALLTIFDDGGDEGEDVRIRAESFVIGRTQGDAVIPHDDRISGRHAEIRRALDGSDWIWSLNDLGSTNGTFVRVYKCPLKAGQELMIGPLRFRFEDTAAPSTAPAPSERRPATTAAWQSTILQTTALVEVTSQGDGRKWPITATEAWIGCDAGCTVALENPMVAPRHARLWRTERGWRLESPDSRDGVWLRIDKPVTVDRNCSFQLGEQRFRLKVL